MAYYIKGLRHIKRIKMEKLLSVIIPCYNAGKYVAKCLDSLLQQTIGIHFLEIIVIDDASIDNSLFIINQYEEQYPDDILVIPLEKNEGQANARNIGMHYVSAEYFTFLDADDWMDFHAYEKLLYLAHEYKCDLIQCGQVEYIEEFKPKYNYLQNPIEPYFIHSANERLAFFDRYVLSGMIGCSIYRTGWIRDHGLEFKKFAKYEDNYWSGLVRYSLRSYCSIPDCLSYYRILQNSNSHARNDDGHFVRLDVELQKIQYYIQKGFFQTYYKDIRNNFLESFYVATLHIILCKFDYVPLEEIHLMQGIVKDIYPDYLEYCKENSRFINPVLTVAFNFPQHIWEAYKRAYLKWIQDGIEDDIAEIYIGLRNALNLKNQEGVCQNEIL